VTSSPVDQWRVEAPAGVAAETLAVAPPSLEAVAEVLGWASAEGRRVQPWGGGTHLGPGGGEPPDLVLLTGALDRVVDWQPEDLTLVVEGGVLVSEIEALLGERRQSAVLAEHTAGSTIGGMIAAGISGYRRLRYGPTRDRMLEVTMATGDGRIVTAGGRVVKNVTGYDIPRLACGSEGSLGVIGQVCLKLWPVPESSASLRVDDVTSFAALYRPLALLETESGLTAYVAGTPEEVAAQAATVGATARPGLDWPAQLNDANQVELRIPPVLVSIAVSKIRDTGATSYRAQHGVGVVTAGFSDWSDSRLDELRQWAESNGGASVVVAAESAEVDRWGTPPGSVGLQRRVKEAFDPLRVMVPGRLPGGV
jgi:glycolate oxidase FAD binding subunit